jgi:hypothetical protein
MICFVQILFLGCVLACVKKVANVDVPSIPIIYVIVLSLVWIGLSYKFFLSNRERTRTIIEDYRSLSKGQKTIWTVASVVIIVVPIALLRILL